MTTPRINIDLGKIEHNAKKLKTLYGSKGINITGVTKVVCGDPRIVTALLKSGIKVFADSRMANIQRMRDAGIDAQFVLIRTPIPSQVMSVVRDADISLNSEISVIKGLSESAVEQHITHKIILMVELGDLREGLMPSDLENTIELIMKLKGIELVGLGTNLACLGGIKPDDNKMRYLSTLVGEVEEKFSLTFKCISGGNSANYNWFIKTKNVGRINNLRIGESIYLGCETLDRTPIPGLFTDAFTLVAEVIESKIKPSICSEEVYQNAFGHIPKLEDRGSIRRAILGVGLQDVLVSGLTPELDIDIIGMSSDHIIVDAKQTNLKVGNEVGFNFSYGALLLAMTSPYIIKEYKES
jgi:predicted amino acid racemase